MIRKYQKDQLKNLAKPLSLAADDIIENSSTTDDALQFWTIHKTRPHLVNLHPLKDGELERPINGTWLGPFTGRPYLIAELAPILKEVMEYLAPASITSYLHCLRSWWRLFDRTEITVQRLSDIGEIHRQRALDEGMDRLVFSNFTRLINIARATQGLSQLYWKSPEQQINARHLPQQWQIRVLRTTLKQQWFKTLARWNRAEQLLDGAAPENNAEIILKKNYTYFQKIRTLTGKGRPASIDLRQGVTAVSFNSCGYNVTEMLKGFYPDAADIRIAFHLCLANTGWNPSVLVNVNADSNFLEPHPKDPDRYILRGFKERGQSEQTTDGLYKTKSSAGVILETLTKRTKPLRDQLKASLKDLLSLRSIYEATGQNLELQKTIKEIADLEIGIRSPWLYLTAKRDSIHWLNNRNCSRSLSGDRLKTFISDVIDLVNKHQPTDKQLDDITPTDFRDAFAAYAYEVSGGAILFVMKALGHRKPSTSQLYLDNSLLNDQSAKLYRAFSNALWSEIDIQKIVDPTIIAKTSRDGDITEEERARLKRYRSLKVSRVGVACKDPTQPPARLAPYFKSDGKKLCTVQRCTLCLENAVILPESLSGLCMRAAELNWIKSTMPVTTYLQSSFPEEEFNTLKALSLFEKNAVEALTSSWLDRIRNGQHIIVEFEGTQ